MKIKTGFFKLIIMEIDYRPWEWVSVKTGNGYSLVKADEETRKKQLEEYKAKKERKLLKELRELEMLH